MRYMSDREFEEKLKKVQERNSSYERKQKLREEQRKYWPKFKLPSTSKIVLMVAAILCVEILFFCQYMIIITGDTNALYAMVGTIAALATIVLGYFAKSTRENTKDGITYETAMASLGQSLSSNSDEAVG